MPYILALALILISDLFGLRPLHAEDAAPATTAESTPAAESIGAEPAPAPTEAATETAPAHETTAYDFSFEPLTGDKPINLAQFRGKVILVVNTASECGFTPQFEGLEKLYGEYQDRGFVIVGVPSNDFAGQEPGTNADIAHFCRMNYGVTFPMTTKEHVTGDDAHPFYKWAYAQLGFLSGPKWNFHKYLIDRNGHIVDYFNSTTPPDSIRIVGPIERLLGQKATEP